MTRQLHAAVPTSETPCADCKDVRDLYHPLNSCGAQPFLPSPFVSRNITPDATGKPAGLTFDEFRSLIRTGVDPEHVTPLLQIMPWPTFRKMGDRDLAAIYEYLSSIPHADTPPPGTCFAPDE